MEKAIIELNEIKNNIEIKKNEELNKSDSKSQLNSFIQGQTATSFKQSGQVYSNLYINTVPQGSSPLRNHN